MKVAASIATPVRGPGPRAGGGVDRAGRTVGLQSEPGVTDLLGQRRHIVHRPWPGARKPDVRRLDPEFGHEVQDPDLVLDRRVLDRGGLQPVAQRLVVQLDRTQFGKSGEARCGVPVVDEVLLVHVRPRLGGGRE